MTDQTDAGDNYPRMPDIRPEELTTTVGPPPPTVTRAVQVMFATAALGVIGLIVTVADRGALKAQLLESDPNIENIDTVVNATVAFSVVLGIVFTALWIGLALMVRKGRNWARIITWVLAGLGVLLAVIALLDPPSVLSAVVTGIGAVLEIAIIVLLAARPSKEFFAGATTKR